MQVFNLVQSFTVESKVDQLNSDKYPTDFALLSCNMVRLLMVPK